jgi:O-antigen/teichoic acid export membrane protein
VAEWALVLFGDEYRPAARTLRWLLLGLPFIYVIWVLHSVAISSNKTRVLLWVTLTGVLLNVALNLWLIPRYSYNGAAAATVVSEFVTMLLLFYGLRFALAGRRSISGEDPAA